MESNVNKYLKIEDLEIFLELSGSLVKNLVH